MELRYSCSVSGSLARCVDRIADPVARESLRQTIEPEVNHRRGVESQQLAYQQSADNRDAERMPQFRTGTRSQSERDTAEKSGHSRHHDWSKSQKARLKNRFFRGLMFHSLGFQREVNHHDG